MSFQSLCPACFLLLPSLLFVACAKDNASDDNGVQDIEDAHPAFDCGRGGQSGDTGCGAPWYDDEDAFPPDAAPVSCDDFFGNFVSIDSERMEWRDRGVSSALSHRYVLPVCANGLITVLMHDVQGAIQLIFSIETSARVPLLHQVVAVQENDLSLHDFPIDTTDEEFAFLDVMLRDGTCGRHDIVIRVECDFPDDASVEGSDGDGSGDGSEDDETSEGSEAHESTT